ncbi:PKD-like domain-containing protein, partial [Flavobacterium sp.]|uniref:PKD-like domain-containing protein n=1 Tax=Flavobacterium sp. TaxID=239 RepID=UPI00342CAE90|nr:hypothetical protein [Flavobacterium sp.]
MNPRILFIFISCLLINTLSSQNLISNGNFESGNGVSFQSDYVFTNPTGQVNSNPREYALLTNPFLMNSNNFVNAVDHTSGTGLMMVCDGASGQSEIFWKTNGDVLLQGGQNYRFTYYVHSVNNTAPQAEIGFRVMSGGTATFSNTYVITSPASGWQEVTYDFLVTGTGNQYRRLELYNVNPSAVGNDFAIDDISLERLAALQARYSVINSSCFGANDGSIVIYGVGGSGIYTSYSIAGTVNLTNTTGVFINLPNGTYTVSVTDNLGVTATIPGVIVVQPANLTLTSNSAICPGSSINLTVSGGSNYNWTASPADPSMTDTTSPTITVSPTVATTYTVTSTQTGPRNLVFNGDFSQGDLGFTSDYQFLAPNNPSGIQGAYGIVNNSQTWFAGFSSCTDHTSGTGNMLVADGSINAAPNDKIWCQTIPVTPGQNYTFSYWVQTVVTGNQANIDVVINGVSVGANSTPAGTCNWIQRTFTWNSGASTVAEICLIDTIVAGNDFAIDDISFTVNATCSLSASVDITITASSATATFGTSTTICPGSSGTLTFNGTPGGIVIFQSSTGANYNVLLNAAGTATWTSPILNVTTIYTLQSIFLPSTGCSTPLTGMVTFTVEVNGCATVLTGGIDVNDPNIPPSCIPGTCIDLSASYVDFGSTSSYAASQITYCPYPFTGPNYTNVTVTGGDDFWSEIINLPFDFCYYNNVYTTCHAGTNGLITFRPVTAGGFCDWPDTSIPINAITNQSQSIFGVFQDTDFSIPPAAPNRAVNYRLEGTYPCRKLIVNFYNMGQWNSTGSAPGLQTSQIVLYEISNIIEVFVQRRVAGTPWAGTGLIGLIGASGAQSIAAPGRDAGNWSAFNEAWRFTPNGPSATTFQWLENGVPISSNTSIVVCPTVTTTYTAEVTYNQCGQIYSVSSSATVTVFDDDTQAPDDLSECNNPFDLTENTAIILGALDPNDYEVNYFLTAADAQLGINIIANPTAFNSTSNPQTIYAGVQNYNTGCNLVKPFDLIISTCTLDPQPTPLFACDDNPVDGFTLFDLTAADTNALNGADPALFTVSYHNSQPDADTGNLPINPATAYSGTDGEIIYVRVEENAVPTTYGTTSFALTINPTPFIADVTQTICSGDTFTVTPVNTAPDVVPMGTTYTWTVSAPVGVTGASDQATPQTTISQTLTNTNATPQDVIYSVTASVGTAPNVCTDTFTITITVNPKPLIADVTQSICTGNTFTVTPANTLPDVVPTGTTYTWTVVAGAVTGASDQATPQTSISQTLSNATANSIDVVYTVTASVGTAPNVCTDTFTITVTVNPEPLIADVVQGICTGNTFTVTPANTAPDVVPTGTTYTWTVTAPVGVSGASNQATPQTSISQTL